MKDATTIRLESVLRWALVPVMMLVFQPAQGQSWQAIAGAQSGDKGTQVLGFLPNEIWIHAGDSVTWTINTDEPHTVSFLKPGQIRPSFQVGCPGTTPSGSNFDGSSCVNSGRITTKGQTYAVTFPTPGNYRLVCLVHANMTGIVHVLSQSEPLPHTQDFYDDQAAGQGRNLLSDVSQDLRGRDSHSPDGFSDSQSEGNQVQTGAGEIISTPGGIQSASRLRFMQPTITIHAGETVEWFSEDVSGHTITFGQEPPDISPATPPSANVFVDSDGARHAIISSLADNVHSGFIGPAPQERTGLAQSAPGFTRFRITFTNAGTYPYICAFHDDVGMEGQVIVLP
jgi:plastocyanin